MSLRDKGDLMDTAADLLTRWADGSPVTVDELGGPEALLDHDDLARTHRLRTVQGICDYWSELQPRRADAIRVLLEAADTAEMEFAGDIHNELLTNADVIGALHGDLEKVVRRRATGDFGILADIAVETWTRLALAGWCTSSLPVCGRLAEMASEARHERDTTSYLVRAVGAALQRWGYDDLKSAMENLRTVDEYDADAAFELALHQIGLACVSSDRTVALDHLRAAVKLFEQAERWEGRVDARAYLGPLRGLLRFIDGGAITDVEVTQARTVVSEYLLGYRGLGRHWRQGRADLTDGWAKLLTLLGQAAEAAESAWFDASSVIEGAAGLLIADTTLTLISRAPGDDNRGVVALVEPRIAATFADQEPSIGFIDRWLNVARAAAEPDTELIDAVTTLRELTTSVGNNPKGDSGPGETEPGSAGSKLGEFRRFYQARQRQLNLTEEHVAHRIFEDIRSIVPDAVDEAAAEISGIVVDLVRFTAHHLGLRQSGSRSPEWLVGGRDSDGHFPGEHRLSDALREWFVPLADVGIEAADIAGGFADVAVRSSRFTFYIEVKREQTHRSDERLVESYGDQATQYAVSDIPVVFLAVLDYAERVTRIDLPGTIWTVRHRHPDASRDYALTGIRVQANTASPSTASAMPLKKKRALKETPPAEGERVVRKFTRIARACRRPAVNAALPQATTRVCQSSPGPAKPARRGSRPRSSGAAQHSRQRTGSTAHR